MENDALHYSCCLRGFLFKHNLELSIKMVLHVWWHFTGCHGAHETTVWSVLLPWWQHFPFVSCRIRLHCRLISVCVRESSCRCSAHAAAHSLSSFALPFPCSHPSTLQFSPPLPKSFLSAWEAETCPGSADLTLRPQGVAVHYCFTVKPVIPACTKIALAICLHIHSLLVVTLAPTTVIVL